MSEELRRLRILARAAQLVAIVIAVVAVAGGIAYLTVAGSDLPSWYPGHITHTTTAHHVARGWVLLGAGVVAVALFGIATWALAGAGGSAEPAVTPPPESAPVTDTESSR